jgi:ribonuclease D
MKLHLELIQTDKELKNLVDKLRGESIIAMDTEFIRERTYIPQLALLQVASREEAWLVDNLAFEPEALKPLLDVFTDPKILKVLHSAYGDQECLYSAYQIIAKPTFDTYEAASLLGYGESVGLRELIKKITGTDISKFFTRTDWLRRPISEEMKRYAMSDVEHLVEIAERLLERLEVKKRKEWAFELSRLSENQDLYINNSEEIARRLAKSGKVNKNCYPILRDLVAWREDRSRELNLPRQRIADNDTLIHIANSRPSSVVQLGKFRGLNHGEIRKQGDQLLEIIKKQREAPGESPVMPSVIKPDAHQARIIDFLSTYLKALCKELQIASRLVLTAKDLGRIVVENLTSPEQWVRAKICSRQACELVGQPLQEALLGKRALAIKNNKLEILHI